ncbi:hypothetical protein OROGR_027011 [Orobanche gracilis]
MSRVYVGNLDSRVSERDLEDEFGAFGVIRRSYSPRDRSPRRRSLSPRGRSYSRSPYSGRDEVPYANRNGIKERRRSRS